MANLAKQLILSGVEKCKPGFVLLSFGELVSGDLKRPTKPSTITNEYTTKDEQWLEKAEKASGWIYLNGRTRAEIHSHRHPG